MIVPGFSSLYQFMAMACVDPEAKILWGVKTNDLWMELTPSILSYLSVSMVMEPTEPQPAKPEQPEQNQVEGETGSGVDDEATPTLRPSPKRLRRKHRFVGSPKKKSPKRKARKASVKAE